MEGFTSATLVSFVLKVFPSILHNRRERFRIKISASHQRPINLFFRHQTLRVLRLHRSTVKNSQAIGVFLPKSLRRLGPDQHMIIAAICGVAVFPVPIAHTGSYAMINFAAFFPEIA